MSPHQMLRFTEPSEFAAAILGSDIDLTLAGDGEFTGDIMNVELGSLTIRRVSENLPLILHSTNAVGRVTFAFHTQPGQSVYRNGIEVPSDAIVQVGNPQSIFQRSTGPMNWGSVSLPLEQCLGAGQSRSDINVIPRQVDQIISPPPGALVNLRRLHAAVRTLATETPELTRSSEAARGLEETMRAALVGCLDTRDIVEPTQSQRRHQAIMQRFDAILRRNTDRPLYVLEIAKAVGASLRSLTECCHEHVGMSPKKYISLRNMHMVRRDLLAANPATTTVTDVATRYGFWQFGRFAGHYRTLFGETPSRTLRRLTGN